MDKYIISECVISQDLINYEALNHVIKNSEYINIFGKITCINEKFDYKDYLYNNLNTIVQNAKNFEKFIDANDLNNLDKTNMLKYIVQNIDLSNLCIAGGIFASILKGCQDSVDIDIFPFGLDDIEKLWERFKKLVDDINLLKYIKVSYIVRTISYINLYIYSGEKYLGTLQFIYTNKYKNRESVVENFDFSCSKIYLNEQKKICTTHCKELILDEFDLSFYDIYPKRFKNDLTTRRIIKYLNKGYNLKIQSFTMEKINQYDLYDLDHKVVLVYENNKFQSTLDIDDCRRHGTIYSTYKSLTNIINDITDLNIKNGNKILFDYKYLSKYLEEKEYSNYWEERRTQNTWYNANIKGLSLLLPSFGFTLEEIKNFDIRKNIDEGGLRYLYSELYTLYGNHKIYELKWGNEYSFIQ